MCARSVRLCVCAASSTLLHTLCIYTSLMARGHPPPHLHTFLKNVLCFLFLAECELFWWMDLGVEQRSAGWASSSGQLTALSEILQTQPNSNNTWEMDLTFGMWGTKNRWIVRTQTLHHTLSSFSTSHFPKRDTNECVYYHPPLSL